MLLDALGPVSWRGSDSETTNERMHFFCMLCSWRERESPGTAVIERRARVYQGDQRGEEGICTVVHGQQAESAAVFEKVVSWILGFMLTSLLLTPSLD